MEKNLNRCTFWGDMKDDKMSRAGINSSFFHFANHSSAKKFTSGSGTSFVGHTR